MLCVFNFTPVPRTSYRIGVPARGHWRELLNTDAEIYGGSGPGNLGGVDAPPVPMHGRPHSLQPDAAAARRACCWRREGHAE